MEDSLSLAEPIPERLRWYKSYMADSDDWEDDGPLEEPTDEKPANLASSLCKDGQHRPALDIDIPMVVIPSSTEGHYHVYFPTVVLDLEAYMKLLDALEVAGILGGGFVHYSRNRGQSLLRLPGVTKESKSTTEGQ